MEGEVIRDDDEVEALGASVDYVGQTIESSKVKYQWHFRIANSDHRVEFFNSKISGRKKLYMDARLIHMQQQLRSSGFEYSWPCQGHLLSLIYDPRAQAFALTINGLPFQLFYRRKSSSASPPSTGGAASATDTGGTSLGAPISASGVPTSDDTELAQLDGAFWSEQPATPDFPTPAGPSEEPHVMQPQLPPPKPLPPQGRQDQGIHGGKLPSSERLHGSRSSSTNRFGGAYHQSNSERPPHAFPSPRSTQEEPLFADLMDLASDKLNISLSPRTRNGHSKP
ncbi:uncharacterized protein LOC34621938 [Cyclospora cayetanensis]|uniref:Uncharacterized protein LOC34621938 n=1 Tax=Cyclospora cayetanensis TaxID=88456 RepID=A0A6P6RRZ1_9EIME|nr:uncharacterized protein LOC34621938 [Cyclospora cayetanensis]